MDNTKTIINKYMNDVLTGKIVACKWTKLACKRHINDIDTAKERGFYFDEDAAQIVVDFCGLVKHSKGELAGQYFKMEPWQMFMVWVLFGWLRTKDNTRRFRTSFLMVARKNGKSFLASAIGLYLLLADNEQGAEVYTAATKKEQANITHKEAIRMIKASPDLQKYCKIQVNNISVEATQSKFEPLGSNSDKLDGLNCHAVIADEVHAWKGRDLWEVLKSSMPSRVQPLMFCITTAGFDLTSICFELKEYAEKILEGTIKDDTFFCLVYCLDVDDEYSNLQTLQKANPNLGVSVKIDFLKECIETCKQMPSEINGFLTKHCNMFTQQQSRWLSIDDWNACPDEYDIDDLIGRECYAGLDLSSTTDLSALVLVFDVDGQVVLLPWFWIPSDSAHKRMKRDRVPYVEWESKGHVTMTDGNVIDYTFIRSKIVELSKIYKIKEIAFDTYNATHLAQQLQEEDRLPMVEFNQSFKGMNEPSKEFERLVISGKINSIGNPVLKWMAGNVAVKQDTNGNIKPVKPDNEKSPHKIDGIVSSIMAIGRLNANNTESAVVFDENFSM